MRILHCCLAVYFVDRYGYQENILPRMHKLQGHEVAILASTETYLENRAIGYVEPRSYHTEDGIPVTRLPYGRGIPHRLARKLRIYPGLYQAVEKFCPDVIFLHGCQFLGIHSIAAYAERHPHVRIYVDGHTDWVNSAKGWPSKHILHGMIYRRCAKAIEPHATKFYGTLPVRIDFLQTMYGIAEEKTALLVLGADDTRFDLTRKQAIHAAVRRRLDIGEQDFLVVSGGKIDRRKNIHVLMRAIRGINSASIKLVTFGVPVDAMKEEIDELSRHECIRHVDWIAAEDVYNYFLAADVAVFPGTHSVLWEQAVGVGIPCIFKKWEGIQHVDVGGNCLFLDSVDDERIAGAIRGLYENRSLLAEMGRVASEKGVNTFSYYQIAQRAIDEGLARSSTAGELRRAAAVAA